MNKKEKLALFLGMLSGDGCLRISHSGQGYRNYPLGFYNTDKKKVELFSQLFLDIFGVSGTISHRDRENRLRIYEFSKTSRKIVEELKNLGFPEGVKRDVLRVLNIIKQGTKNQKAAFIYGVLITDGSLRKKGNILFHSGSKLFLEDLSKLIGEFTKTIKPIKEYIQREIYKSYQLSLNKVETNILLSACRCGTMVLR